MSTYSDWSQPCWVSPALLWISFYLVGIPCTDNLLIPEACKQFHLCEDLDLSQDRSDAATKDQSTSTPNEGLFQLTPPPPGVKVISASRAPDEEAQHISSAQQALGSASSMSHFSSLI